MKYCDPKTGEVYRDITTAWEAFCEGLKDACPACPLTASKTGRNYTCNDFVVKCETEAARLMGLEIITDQEEPMEKKDKPRKMRAEILDAAKTCVCGQREQDYGSPEDNFAAISKLWNAYLGGDVTDAHDMAMMMALLKIARIRTGRRTADSYVDLAGYAACGGEISANGRFGFPSLRPGQSLRLEDVLEVAP